MNGEWQRQKQTAAHTLKAARRSSMKDFRAVGSAAGNHPRTIKVGEASDHSERLSSFRPSRLSSYHPDAHRANRGSKYLQTIVLSICIIQLLAIWYAVAIFFPPEYKWNRSAEGLFWTDGALVRGNGTTPDAVCPKETLCSVGWVQILLLMLSRLTAFIMYVCKSLLLHSLLLPSY